MIYTFYSFKGGVGRSMALANIAELLYNRGLKVLMIDFDLEAPGLERYFDVKKAKYNANDVIEQRGVIDLLVSYKDLRSLPMPPASPNNTTENHEDSFPYPVEPVSNFIVPIYEGGKNGGTLSIMPAGRRAGDQFTRYAERVRSFAWDDFYAKWDGELFFEWFRKQVAAKNLFDIVLIDSRTGVTEMGGVCSYQLADVVMMCVAPNYQNLDGSLKLANSLARSELIEKARKGRPLSLLFIPSRVEQGLGDKLTAFKERFDAVFSSLTPEKLRYEKGAFVDLMVPYAVDYAFTEDVAVREPDSPKAVYLNQAFEKIVAIMAQLEPESSPFAMLYAPKDETEQLIKLAEEIFAQFTEAEQQLARKLFVQLVRPSRSDDRSEDSRTHINLSSLDEPTRQIARKLSEARLLVIERDSASEDRVQFAQEALIRKWQRLQQWVQEDLDFLLWRQGLQSNMTDWDKNRQDSSTLLRGSRLNAAKDWQDSRREDLTESEKLYIQLSLQKRLRSRLIYIGNILLVSIMVLVTLQTYLRQTKIQEIEKKAQAAQMNGQGLEKAANNEIDSAIENYNQAIKLDENFSDAYYNRAKAYITKGDYDRAIADLEQVTKLQPALAEAYYDLGVAWQKTGNPDQALLNLNRAIELNSDYKEAYKARATVYLEQDKLDMAIADLNNVIKSDLQDAESYSKRGLAYQSLKQYDQALADYNKAISLKPDYAEAYLNRGQLYQIQNNRSAAVADLKIAAKSADDKVSSKANKALEPLGQTVVQRVYIEYVDPADQNTINLIANLLRNKGYRAIPQLTPNKSSGDVRYYFEEDKQVADEIRGIVTKAVSGLGLKLNIKLFFRGGQSSSVSQGHIEVWLPSLTPDV
jgi:tetratricopeptide (TPR) repeat protein